MNRNGTAILATAILFSMLATSGVRPGPSVRSGTSALSAQRPTSSSNKLAHTNCEGSDCKNPKRAGNRAYQNEITELFKQYCQDGRDKEDRTDKKDGTDEMESTDDKAETVDTGCELQPDNFIIAIVPDPVHTHLALYFDRTIDTIEEALQDDGWLFYRAIVPWDQEAHPQPDDYTLRLNAKQYQESREQLPGIMLFSTSASVDGDPNTRKDTPKDDALKDPLAVMLVGESPTGGVNKDQFLNAIERIRQLTRTKEKGEIKKSEIKLKILGPTFSGSLYSLKKLLTCGQDTQGDIPCFASATILSGAITGREAVEHFGYAVKNFQAHEKDRPLKTTFDTLQETDEVMLQRFIEFIAGKSYGDRNYDVRRIAELSEDETAYGSFRHSALSGYPPESGYCKPYPPAPKSTAPSQNPTQSCLFLKLYFPREISQLRAAYQDNPGSAGATERLPFQNLPHNFGITGDDDTVASFSQKQTPLSQEAVLLSIVAELRKHAIQFVVLNATDPLDTLFLSHYLRSAYPQGRIVTMGADMLFPREVEDTTLHGILALSTYSVSPSANHQFYQLWQSGAERMFPSSFDVGTYNALHSLMTAEVTPPPDNCDHSIRKNDCTDRLRSILPQDKNSKEDTSKEIYLYLIQYGWRERGNEGFALYNAPPVRLSALGHDGYWLVANLGPVNLGPDEKKTHTVPTLLPEVVGAPPREITTTPLDQFSSAPAPLEVPDSWIVIEVSALALAAGFCISVWFSSVRSPWQQLAQFAPTMYKIRVWLIASAGLLLIYVLLILLWPFFHGHHDWVIANALRHQAILLSGICVVFTVTLVDISQRSRLYAVMVKRGRDGRRMLVWPDLRERPVVLAFVAASMFIAYFTFVRPEHPEENLAGLRHFAVLRAIQLTSGLSPALPILFLLGACLWWANHILAGWILLDDRCPLLPSSPEIKSRIAQKGEIAQDLRNALQPGFSSITHYLVLLGIALGVLLLTGVTLTPIRTIESPRFDRSQLLPFLVIASAGLIGTTLRLWTIWFRTRRLLVALDSTPLRRGFQRLEGFTWKPIWKFGGVGALSEYQRLLARQSEALQTAANMSQELTNSKKEIDKAMEGTIDAAKTAGEHHYPTSSGKSEGRVQDKVKAYLRALFSAQRWAASRDAEHKLIHQFGRYQSLVSLAAGNALVDLEHGWKQEGEERKRKREQETFEELRVRAYERFVSLVYVSFLLVVLARMRTLIMAISGMYILILLALTLYPFEPRPSIQIYLVVMLAFIVIVVGLVFAQIHRDATLSHITDTKPGELGGDFYLRMASFIALPLFTFFASQFPEIGRFFYSWLEPALQALNR